MTVVYLLISLSLPSNVSTCHSIVECVFENKDGRADVDVV
jgi:hypothetical protein